MPPLLKRILKVSTYGLFVAATFAFGLMSGGGRDHKIFGEFSLPTIDTAHADAPPVGSDAGCAGSGDGSGGGEGSGEGSGDGGGSGAGSGAADGSGADSGGGADGSGADGGGGADGSGGDGGSDG